MSNPYGWHDVKEEESVESSSQNKWNFGMGANWEWGAEGGTGLTESEGCGFKEVEFDLALS